MDFHHFLPSNTSPDYFPNNNASQYSTPVDNPYDLTGNWEVGLMDVTFSSCIKTFNNDKMMIKETVTLEEFVRQKGCPVKVWIPVYSTISSSKQAREHIVSHLNEMFESFFSIKLEAKYVNWKLLTDKFYFILSPGLRDLFKFWSDVLTSDDKDSKNYDPFYNYSIQIKESDYFIIIVPVEACSAAERVDFTLKAANEKITPETLAERFKSKVSSDIATLILKKTGKFYLKKIGNDNKLIVLNRRLRRAVTFRRGALFTKGEQKYVGAWFKELDKPWIVSIYTLKKVEPYNPAGPTREVILPPFSFNEEQEAVRFLIKQVNDNRILFTCDKNKRLTLTISSKTLTVTLDDNLRDIFAFDKNIYSGLGSYTANGDFSLSRRIQHLYIYSNLTGFTRVGNTESPLLAIVPLMQTDKCVPLQEKVFKIPMYIKLCSNRLSQIDIAIYDGAGQLVPFASDAVTTLHLHFRKS